MTEPRLVLVGVAVLLEAPQDDEGMHDRMSVVSEALREAARQMAASQPDCKPMDVISYHYLGEEGENAAQCSRCGVWGTDFYKPDPIDGLAVGFTIDSRFLCDRCRIRIYEDGPAQPRSGEYPDG